MSNMYPTDYVRRSEFAKLQEQLNRALKVIEEMQKQHAALVDGINNYIESVDHNFEVMNSDIKNIGDAVVDIQEHLDMVPTLTRSDDEDDEEELDAEVDLVYVSADKKVLH